MKSDSFSVRAIFKPLDGIDTRIGQTLPELAADVDVGRLVRHLDRTSRRRFFRASLILADLTGLIMAFGAAYAIRFLTDWPVFQVDGAFPDQITFYVGLVYALIPLWLMLFTAVGLYDDQNLLGGTREYALVFNGVSTGMLLVVVASFLNPQFVIARGWLLMSWLLAFCFVAGLRFTLRRVVYSLRNRGHFLAPSLIVGLNDEAMALAQQLVGWQTSGLRVLGFVAPDEASARLELRAGATGPGERVYRHLAVVGGLDDLERLVDRFHVEEIVIATSALHRNQLVDLFRRFTPRAGVNLRLSSGLFEIMTTGLQVKELAYVPLINIDSVRLRGFDVAVKTLMDYTVALAAAIVGAPLYLALAAAIKLDSPGPVFHRRRVLGLGGKEFDALKFRTMCQDGAAVLSRHPELERRLATEYKLKDDPRITRTGRWLRKLSLDELPQVFNVLLGQMSVVGPRMISPAEHAEYGQWDMNLLTVKPGITGLWQVSGRSDVTYAERVRLDMHYIRNWTIWLDIQILLQTIPAVLRGRGAY